VIKPVNYLGAEMADASAISALTIKVIRAVNVRDYTSHEIELACTKFSSEYFSSKILSRTFFKAILGTEIVGQGSYSEGKIHRLFVDPIFHGQGIGRLLLGKLESAAIDDARNHVLLSSSMAAKGFYSKFGYTLLRSESTPFGITFLIGKNLQT
jgi:GNAT superfamily N-acetyltransferase